MIPRFDDIEQVKSYIRQRYNWIGIDFIYFVHWIPHYAIYHMSERLLWEERDRLYRLWKGYASGLVANYQAANEVWFRLQEVETELDRRYDGL